MIDSTRNNILAGIPDIEDGDLSNEVRRYIDSILNEFERFAEDNSEMLKGAGIDSLSNISEGQESLEKVASNLY